MSSRLSRARWPRGLRAELPALLRLAVPVILAELGWMAMSLVDTMMVGRVNAVAIGAVSIGGTIFYAVAVFGMGLLLGLDYLVAHAVGARDLERAHRALLLGLCVSTVLAAFLTVCLGLTAPALALVGIRTAVLAEAVPYLRTLTWSLLPLLWFTCLRRYLQAMGLVMPVMVAVISANLINVIADWVLIFGHLGLPALGAEGAGWATLTSRVYMLAALAVFTVLHARRHQTGLLDHGPGSLTLVDVGRLRELVRLGLPAAVQTSLEVGVFAAATALAGRLAPASLAAHQIALSAISFVFMVPLGLSSAAAVRVGLAAGRGHATGVARAGWTALLVGAIVMLGSGLVLVWAPDTIMRIFTTDGPVISTGISLLLVAAVFQLFDGTQVVVTGVLRGIGDTRTAMISNLIAHWFVGLPLGAVLCFWMGWDITGLWLGLSVGLISVAVVLTTVWSRRIAALTQARRTVPQSRPPPSATERQTALRPEQ